MKHKRLNKTEKLLIILYLIGIFLFFANKTEAKMEFPTHHREIKLQNEPIIGQITIIKQTVVGGYDDPNVELGCFFSEGLELINSGEYKISLVEPPVALEKGFVAFFYSGPLKKGESKEAIFKVRIPDGKKYAIGQLEIDLGDPEPPELTEARKDSGGIKDGKLHIKTAIKQLISGGFIDLAIPEDSLPPLRTELRMRTKERPEIGGPPYPWPLPFRYLVYLEKESSKVEVSCILPMGFATVGELDYKIFQEPDGNIKVLLYSGPMRSKECKAIYFRIGRNNEINLPDGLYNIKSEVILTTLENEKLIKTDSYPITLGRVLY